MFEDYEEVRGWMNWLMDRLDGMDRPKCLSHIDANVDNLPVFEEWRGKTSGLGVCAECATR